MISASTVNEMIRSWRKARRSADCSHLGYPSTNILHYEHGLSGSEESPYDADAEAVQGIVELMPDWMRTVFEAYHLGVIRQEYCGNYPHKVRCQILGLDKDTYKLRETSGWEFVQEQLLTRLGMDLKKTC